MFSKKARKKAEPSEVDELETSVERKQRLISLYIVHFSMFVVSLGSSIIFTGVYPYLLNLEPEVGLAEYGMVVAADAAAQMIFSPIFGFITDKLKTVRPVALGSCVLFSGGNVMYALVGVFPRLSEGIARPRVWIMLAARFIVGIGTAVNSTSRYYVSMATKVEERTSHIALLSLFQTLGFIVGPGLQTALAPLGSEYISPDGNLVFDMYTSTGWIGGIAGGMCLILYLPGIFTERYVAAKEIEFNKTHKNAPISADNNEAKDRFALHRKKSHIHIGPTMEETKEADPKQLLKSYSRISMFDAGVNFSHLEELEEIEEKSESDDVENSEDKEKGTKKEKMKMAPILPTVACTYNNFSFMMNFVLLETIVTPLAMDQWGWSQEEAIVNIGFVMIGGGVLSLFVFASIGPLSKRVNERILLLVAGLIPMILGRVVMFPFPGAGYPPEAEGLVPSGGNTTTEAWDTTLQSFHTGDMDVRAGAIPLSQGCGYDWCDQIPKITVAQFMIGYVFATLGYPFCVALNASIYSKVLGDIPQGFWLGLLTTSGSLSRVIGPLVVTGIYEKYGTYLTFGIVTGTLVLSGIITLVSYKKLVPPAKPTDNKTSD